MALVNSVNPVRLRGAEDRRRSRSSTASATLPTYHLLPVGNAGNIAAYWLGYQRVRTTSAWRIASRPVMRGFQA